MSSEQGGSCWWSLDVWYPIHEAGQDREGPPSHQAASAGSPIPPTVEAVGGRSSRLWNAPARKVSSSNATRKLVGMSLLATWLSWFGCFAHRWHLWTCWRETMVVVVDEDIRWHLYKWPSSPNSGHNSYQRHGFMRCNCFDILCTAKSGTWPNMRLTAEHIPVNLSWRSPCQEELKMKDGPE